MSLPDLLARWKNDPDTAPNISFWRTTLGRPASLAPLPGDLPQPLADALHARGLTALYSHQSAAWTHAHAGENIALATGTASGKTLGYNLPVLAALLENPQARALYLFPTKALTQDQLSALNSLIPHHPSLTTGIYDGDTPQSKRKSIRDKANIIFTNPDMLHTGILPHHTRWADFFRSLKFIVIDEMHTYRGVFGSHVANVIRRLKRVAAFYGSHPQFILTSATIGNPKELAERLIEAPVTLIDNDGSSRGERHFLIYNPPVVDESLGLRKSALLESVRLTQELLAHAIQNVVFARSRRSVEILLTYLQLPPSPPSPLPNSGRVPDRVEGRRDEGQIRGYRSGYLPAQRREIEKGLRDGSVKTVVATNALELGIDIGGLGAAVLVGYPGTIASVYQQAGRAGRGDDPALGVFVATPNPLDQFLAHHPDYFFGRSPEQALINPDHLLILLNHLRCAIFELPFKKGEGFGALDAKTVEEFLEFLINNNEAHRSQDKYFWMADAYPAANVSLRSASPESVVLQATDSDGQPTIIGEVDYTSALWMVHPNAVYLHEAQQYFVQALNIEQQRATLIPVALEYYTEPVKETRVKVLSVNQEEQLTTENTESTEKIKKDSVNSAVSHRRARGPGGVRSAANKGLKAFGELAVTTQVVGFKKLRWFTRENLGQEPLDLPPTDFQTTGYWLSISDETVKALSADGLWTNAPNDYGTDWPKIRDRVRTRDGFRCQVCGAAETSNRQHDVHHKVPFRSFRDESGRILRARANQLDNLVTLCQSCHHNVEQNVRMRSGLAGLSYVLSQLAPLYLMCDPGDLGTHIEPVASESFSLPSVVLYDLIPAGIGFSQKLFEMHDELIARALELVSECPCEDGCPSCVGPGGENGYGGKQETLALLKELS